MDQLNSMRAFRQVAESASFSVAAEKLQLSNGAVSKLVSALENRLGVQLLMRTTRHVSLTDSGRSYLERCAQILNDLDEAESALSQQHGAPRGLIKVNAPVSFTALNLGNAFAAFLQRYPEINLDLILNDRFIDPVEEGFDLVLRVVKQLPDSTLIARKLANINYVICAAPSYLLTAGTPQKPEHLSRHQCLLYGQATGQTELRLNGPDGARRLKIPLARYQSNNSLPLRDALLAGLGVALMPKLYVEGYLKEGKLIALLPNFTFEPSSLYALYPRNRHMSANVRVLIDFLVAHLAPHG
jgi:DNA-binding transcriptional LysR family regulator